MKSKRIVALALTAAMAVSMAGLSASAATWQAYTKWDKKNNTTYEFWGIRYQTGDDSGTQKTYYFMESEIIVKSQEDASTGEIKYTKGISAETRAAFGDVEAELPFSKIKDKLKVPANDPESNKKFVGWSDKKGKTGTTMDDVKKFVLTDDYDVATHKDAKKGVVKFYPVTIDKNMQDKVKDYEEIAARPKIAKTKDDKEWKYTEQELVATASKEKASSDEGKEDCEKCNTTTGKSVVFDVKPIVRESGKEVILRTSRSPQVEVILPITRLLTAEEKEKLKDDRNKLIDDLKKQVSKKKDNALKVFHIGNDGLSHSVKSFDIVWAVPTGATEGEGKEVCVKFKYGFFSDFVVTRDKDARAQAGREKASSGNPATGEASALPVALLALASLSATGVVVYKKRKAE